MVLAMQRTLDDLQTMLCTSSCEEVSQLNGRIGEVIAAYQRVVDGAQVMPAREGADSAVAEAEAEDYVLVPRTDVAADAQSFQMNLASGNGDAAVNAQNSQAELANHLGDRVLATQEVQNELANGRDDAAPEGQNCQINFGNYLAEQDPILQESRVLFISGLADEAPEAQDAQDFQDELTNIVGEMDLNTNSD